MTCKCSCASPHVTTTTGLWEEPDKGLPSWRSCIDPLVSKLSPQASRAELPVAFRIRRLQALPASPWVPPSFPQPAAPEERVRGHPRAENRPLATRSTWPRPHVWFSRMQTFQAQYMGAADGAVTVAPSLVLCQAELAAAISAPAAHRKPHTFSMVRFLVPCQISRACGLRPSRTWG